MTERSTPHRDSMLDFPGTDSSLASAKAALRQAMRQRARSLTPEERATASLGLARTLRAQPLWASARRVAAFAPRLDEPDLEPVLKGFCRDGGWLYLPRWSPERNAYDFARVQEWERDLGTGAFGLREPGPQCPPLDNKQLDLVLVPGLAFGPGGERLGRGKGFYDRLLPQVSGALCGVGYDWQVLPEVPAGAHDHRLDYIVTPTRWIACGPRAA